MSSRLLAVSFLIAGLAGFGFTQEPNAHSRPADSADVVGESLDEADRCLSVWDVRGAWAAALRAGYIVERDGWKDACAQRAHLTLAHVARLRGLHLCSWMYLARATACDGGPVPHLRTMADGLAFLACLTPGLSSPQLGRALGQELHGVLTPEVVEAVEALPRAGGPTAVEVERYVFRAIRVSHRISKDCGEPGFALAVLVAAQRSVDRHASGVEGAEVDRARLLLTYRIDRDAGRAASQILDTVDRLGIESNSLGIPRNPGLALGFGECFRARALARRLSIEGTGSSERGAGDPLSWNRTVAHACYRSVLDVEPDHVAAAIARAALHVDMGQEKAATSVLHAVVRRLLDPSCAWIGKPVLPAAPRYLTVGGVVDLLAREVGRTNDFFTRFEAWAGKALIQSYLEFGPRFHPEDTVASPHPFPDVVENNVGYELMRSWDFTGAAQLFRRCIWRNRKRTGGTGLLPIALQNLGHVHWLTGEFQQAVACYRKASEADARNAVARKNLGAIMAVLATIDLDPGMLRECAACYQRAVFLAPGCPFARSSLEFVHLVEKTWERYLNQDDRSPAVVLSFARSFLYAAQSATEGKNPRYVQALWILDQGLRALPDDEELARILAGPFPSAIADQVGENPEQVKSCMVELHDRCFRCGVKKYEALLQENGAENPHMNYLLAEIHRMRWRHDRRAENRDRAMSGYEKVLVRVPDHVAAALALAELLQGIGREPEAIARLDALVTELAKPWRPWEGEPEVEAGPRVEDMTRLDASVARRLPATEGWSGFRRRLEARIQALQSPDGKKRRSL